MGCIYIRPFPSVSVVFQKLYPYRLNNLFKFSFISRFFREFIFRFCDLKKICFSQNDLTSPDSDNAAAEADRRCRLLGVAAAPAATRDSLAFAGTAVRRSGRCPAGAVEYRRQPQRFRHLDGSQQPQRNVIEAAVNDATTSAAAKKRGSRFVYNFLILINCIYFIIFEIQF